MIITRTPLRVSFLGGGTDYPAWSEKHGGLVVGGAINRYAYLTVRRLPPFHKHKTRVVYSKIEEVAGNDAIQHPAVREILAYLGMQDAGLEIFHQSDLPSRSGTGSSSTFAVGLLNALAAMRGKRYPPDELARDATFVEQKLLGETVGCQDQAWAAFGGLNAIRFKQDGEIAACPLLLNVNQVKDLEKHLMLFFTGIARTSSDIAGAYAPSLGDLEKEQWAMLRFAEEGIEAVEKGRYERLGKLIDLSWRVKASLPGVATPDIHDWYCLARLSGAWGGKITGAGGGGCMLLVAPPENQPVVEAAMTGVGMIRIPFRFDHDGSTVIFTDREDVRHD